MHAIVGNLWPICLALHLYGQHGTPESAYAPPALETVLPADEPHRAKIRIDKGACGFIVERQRSLWQGVERLSDELTGDSR